MTDECVVERTIDEENAGQRIDKFLAAEILDRSRAQIQDLIKEGRVTVLGVPVKPSYRLTAGDIVVARVPAAEEAGLVPQQLPLDVIYQDDDVVVVNKPAGMVVHPAAGHKRGTLVNALLHHCPALTGIGGQLRPGIVHRLDKDTSGTLVVAKTPAAHADLARQFHDRRVQKIYLALVYGQMPTLSGQVDLPVGRHPVDRKRMSTASRRGRWARTRWRAKEVFGGVSLLELELLTGRTHQIRVHCAHLQHPVVGDRVYSSRRRLKEAARQLGIQNPGVADALLAVNRQMLHARQLSFSHPQTGRPLVMQSPLPADMQQLIDALRHVGS